MTILRAPMLLALWLALVACAPLPARDDPAGAAIDAADRQILVMLRAPPPHFRPDGVYGAGAYSSRVGDGGQWRRAEGLARRHDLKLVTGWPMPALGVDCFVMEAGSRDDVAHVTEELAGDARVESAQAMQVFHVLGHNDPLYPLQPGARLWHIDEVHRLATGRNVRVAEVDTGVDADHPDLRGRVAMARDFAGAPAAPHGEPHGTAVAGIIAARADDGIGIAGIAPDARLYALRACRQSPDDAVATCTSFTLAAALQFALDQNVQVINLSLGGPRDRLLERLLDAALARRVVIVGAVDGEARDGGFPASHPGVVAVAGEAAGNLPAGAVLAPGRDVPTTTVGRTWGFVSGSSYAAAEVSGVVALLLERAPGMDTAQVRSALRAGAVAGALPGPPVMVDACSAVAQATSECVCGCVVARSTNPIVAH